MKADVSLTLDCFGVYLMLPSQLNAIFSNVAKPALVSRDEQHIIVMAPSDGMKRLKVNKRLDTHGTFFYFFLFMISQT